MSRKRSKSVKRIVGVALAALILIGMQAIPLPEGLSREGLCSIGFWGAAICLWICESTPFSISTILLIVMMPFYGIITLEEVWGNFASSTFFFIFASFAITAAMATSNIPRRFATLLIRMSGASSMTLLDGDGRHLGSDVQCSRYSLIFNNCTVLDSG